MGDSRHPMCSLPAKSSAPLESAARADDLNGRFRLLVKQRKRFQRRSGNAFRCAFEQVRADPCSTVLLICTLCAVRETSGDARLKETHKAIQINKLSLQGVKNSIGPNFECAAEVLRFADADRHIVADYCIHGGPRPRSRGTSVETRPNRVLWASHMEECCQPGSENAGFLSLKRSHPPKTGAGRRESSHPPATLACWHSVCYTRVCYPI